MSPGQRSVGSGTYPKCRTAGGMLERVVVRGEAPSILLGSRILMHRGRLSASRQNYRKYSSGGRVERDLDFPNMMLCDVLADLSASSEPNWFPSGPFAHNDINVKRQFA